MKKNLWLLMMMLIMALRMDVEAAVPVGGTVTNGVTAVPVSDGSLSSIASGVVATGDQKISTECLAQSYDADTLIHDKEWGYQNLNEHQKKIYRELRDGLAGRYKEFHVSSLDKDEIFTISENVKDDHPEFFADGRGFTYLVTREDGIVRDIDLEYDWVYSPEESKLRLDTVEFIVDRYIETIPPTYTDWDKIKAAYFYVMDKTEFLTGAPDNQNMCSVYLNGKSVCAGYVRAMQYMLQKMGIRATMADCIYGDGLHAVLIAEYGGVNSNKWTYCDPTFGDTSGEPYRFLGMSSAEAYQYYTFENYFVPPAADHVNP